MEEYSDVLVASKRDTSDYAKGLEKLKKLLNAKYKFNLDDKFMEDNVVLIERMIAGGEDGQKAYEEFMINAANYSLLTNESLGLTEE
jgi:hypothetical protein